MVVDVEVMNVTLSHLGYPSHDLLEGRLWGLPVSTGKSLDSIPTGWLCTINSAASYWFDAVCFLLPWSSSLGCIEACSVNMGTLLNNNRHQIHLCYDVTARTILNPDSQRRVYRQNQTSFCKSAVRRPGPDGRLRAQRVSSFLLTTTFKSCTHWLKSLSQLHPTHPSKSAHSLRLLNPSYRILKHSRE